MHLLLVAVLAGGQLPADGPAEPGSYLWQPAFCIDKALRGPPRAYVPQPGDLMLATDDNMFWGATHDWAFAFEPHGSGIVFARPDGGLAMLEAGPNDTFRCRNLDLLPHLQEYDAKGEIWIRKRMVPLTPEQSCRLTEFALRQNCKRFAIGRLGAQLTFIRNRGPLRTWVLGKPRGDRRAYFCSELVTEACVAAGLVNPETARPSATYPHDLFFGRSYNLYLDRHLEINCYWEPPARWTCRP